MSASFSGSIFQPLSWVTSAPDSTMPRKMAEAMNCQFVYAIVPNDRIETVVYQRALKKARAQVKEASVHMALEDQALNKQQLEQQIERLAQNLMEQMSADLWNDHE